VFDMILIDKADRNLHKS